MKMDRHAPKPDAPAAVALATALEKSHDVKAKVEACADDLASANEVLKERIADGATTLAAGKALSDNEAVEAQIQACVIDLHDVTDSLAQGVDDHRRNETALTQSLEALARTQAALASSLEQERAATRRSLHDQLTDIPNRRLFDDRLEHAIAIAQRRGWTLAVMFFDIDRFKSINDAHGHATGDIVLKAVASRLLGHARDEDTVCRNGGDEFLCLLMNPQGRENVERIAGVLSQGVALPIDVDGIRLLPDVSIGIALFPEHGTSGDALVRAADAAMYRAKAQGTRIEVFEER
jgi:diguanylate cyclase (GGDEF)-like protein